MTNTRGEVSVTFNWIYILIAGAVILLFFFGLLVRQKASSEEQLTADLTRILETLLAGAGVSEKTKNSIDTSGLAEYTLSFSCYEGTSELGLKESAYRSQNSLDPIFSPSEIKSPQLITWSLPFHFPFKVIDFLFVTAPNVKYYLYGSSAGIPSSEKTLDQLEEEFSDFGNFIRVEKEGEYELINPEKNFHIRIVSDGTRVNLAAKLPPKLRGLADQQVSLVLLSGSQARYYQKDGDSWSSLGPAVEIFSLLPLGQREAKDPAKFAAVFAGTPELYQCNLGKALKRLGYVGKLYQRKASELITYYKDVKREPLGNCMAALANNPANIHDSLGSMLDYANSCASYSESCSELQTSAQSLDNLNQQLGLDCIALY